MYVFKQNEKIKIFTHNQMNSFISNCNVKIEVVVENKYLYNKQYKDIILLAVDSYKGKKTPEGKIIECELVSILSNKIIYENYYCRTVFQVEVKQQIELYPKVGTTISNFKIIHEDEKNNRCIVEITKNPYKGLKVYINKYPFKKNRFTIKEVKIINDQEEIVGE